MDYQFIFREMEFERSSKYKHNDISIANIFHYLHSDKICYVVESKAWFTYNGKHWEKDECSLTIMELCKNFVQALATYGEAFAFVDDDGKAFAKYTSGFHTRRKREGLLSDARSIAPKSLNDFDRNKLLFNCKNGTFNLQTMTLQRHSPSDFISKMANVQFVEDATCERWGRFIKEIMCEDNETAIFLQKALGYALSGDTALECFFILYGNTTRNGKSTLTETIANIFGDYARNVQPQTLAKRSSDGGVATPDIARLKGARLVNTPEPEKGLELNIALIKQLTGGDTYTSRALYENLVEFKPEFKIFINTNHLPRSADDTVFTSNRVKLIPFDRHFNPQEQDNGLKKQFRKGINKSAILNWLITGYKLLQAEGLTVPSRVANAIASYRQETDIFGQFLFDCTAHQENNRLSTSELYSAYTGWVKDDGYRQMNNKNFVAELRRRFDVRRDGGTGNVVIGLVVCLEPNPFVA